MAEHPALTIAHNAAAHRFEVTVEGQLCHCDYVLEGTVMSIVHTKVPAQLEGRGIAAQLVKAAFDHARAQHLTVIPACSYVRSYVERHPETRDLLAAH